MPYIQLGECFGSWHRWLIDHETVLDRANYFPNDDWDTGRNMVVNTRLFDTWDKNTPAPTIVEGLNGYRYTLKNGASSTVALLAFMGPLAETTREAGVIVPASSLAEVAAQACSACGYQAPRTRSEATPAALALIAEVLSRWPGRLHEVEDEIIGLLDRSRAVNVARYQQPGPPPPDAGAWAWMGLLRVSLDLLAADLAEERHR